MTDPHQVTTSLLTEHLQYTPLSLIDDIINRINEIIYQFIPQLESTLLDADPLDLGFSVPASTNPDRKDDKSEKNEEAEIAMEEQARAEIENGVNQLETLLESTMDKNFDRFEIYVLRNILTVPEDLAGWIRLKHYENIRPPTSKTPTPQTITGMMRTLHETQKLHSALLAESNQTEQTLSQLRALLSRASKPGVSKAGDSTTAATPSLSFLSTTSTPLSQTSTFTASQLPALRTLLTSLRTKLPSLPSRAKTKNPRDEERQKYIESRTRRYLERNYLLDMNWEGGNEDIGDRRTKEEVESLEAWAGTFGKWSPEEDEPAEKEEKEETEEKEEKEEKEDKEDKEEKEDKDLKMEDVG